MMTKFFEVMKMALLLLTVITGASLSYAQVKEVAPGRRIAETPQAVEAGKKLYPKYCNFCHGDQGGGDGPVAEYLNPKPRNFKLGQYKFRTTGSGEPPTDEDLFRIINRGIPGTAMPSWSDLKEEELWQLIYYIKTFAENPWPKSPPPQPMKFGKEIGASAQIIQKGKEVYKKAKCWECHGDSGRGDGPSAPTLKDDLGNFTRALNFTKGWNYRAGKEARDIFTRFSTGIDTSPMPSYADSLSEEERWQLAHYVKTFQTKDEPGTEVVLRAKRVKGELPLDPSDSMWQRAESIVFPLSGQILVRPRWQTPAVDVITVRALFNEKAIAFLLAWDDPFKDTKHQEATETANSEMKSTYAKVDLSRGKYENLRDAVALQFPVRIPEGTERPFFFRGGPGKPVYLWEWKADWQEQGGRKTPVEEYNAEGFKKPHIARSPESQEIMGKGVWSQGQWKIVMTRSLVGKDKTKDITFVPGKLIPIAIQAWDGSNGEKGFLMSLSSWHFLLLPEAKPITVYLYPLVGLFFAGALEFWLVRRFRKKS